MDYERLPHGDVLAENAERLTALEKFPFTGFCYDHDGFVFGRNREINHAIMRREANLLRRHLPLATVTGVGYRLFHRADTLLPFLAEEGLNPQTAPMYFSICHGTYTAHAFTKRPLDSGDHPLDEKTVRAITENELVRTIQKLTTVDDMDMIMYEYSHLCRAFEFSPHALASANPGIRFDVVPTTGKTYQVGIYYPDNLLNLSERDHRAELEVIRRCYAESYKQEELPKNQFQMAQILKDSLGKEGWEVEVHASETSRVVDITCEGKDKSVGCNAVVPVIANCWGIAEQEATASSLGGGDSPAEGQNDEPLMNFFGHAVTNSHYFPYHGRRPVVLNYPEIRDPIRATLIFMSRMRTAGDI